MTATQDITSGVAYAPLYKWLPGMSAVQAAFCFDQQKRNMLALLGEHTIEEIATLLIAADIHEYMDSQTREHLRRLPLAFVAYWQQWETGTPAITRNWPDPSAEGLLARAKDLQHELVGDEANVIHVNFKKLPPEMRA